MTVDIVTFGCRLNAFESEAMRTLARNAAHDTVIVNTCAVTAEAERQARQTIRKLVRERPDARIVVTGCAAQIDPAAWAALPGVHRVLGNDEKMRAASWAPGAGSAVGDIMLARETAAHLVTEFAGRARAFVQVQQGCDHRCTFCVIPFGRGPNRSVPIGAIVTQVRTLVERGYQEVVLTGVDIASYGPDLPGQPRLGQMVRRLLAQVPELPRLRLSSLDPAAIDDDLWRLIADEPRLMPHLHLSLQAASDLILKRMKRRHLVADARAVIDRARGEAGDRGRRRSDRGISDRNRCIVPGNTGFRDGKRSAVPACVSVQRTARHPRGAHARRAEAGAQVTRRPLAPGGRGGLGRVLRGAEGAHRLHPDRKRLERTHGTFRAGTADGRNPAGPGADRPRPRHRGRNSVGGGSLMALGSFFGRLKEGLTRSTAKITETITAVFNKRHLDDVALEELEDLLISADLGIDAAARVIASFRRTRFGMEVTDEEIKQALAEEIAKILQPVAVPLILDPALKPHVVLVVGVNGTGKTTTIGKLAQQYHEEGKRAVLVAGDTFRAAAVEQLQIWGQRTGAPVIAGGRNADSAGLAFDALTKAKAEGADVLLIDTAGRLHNKAALMAELTKMIRVLRKQDETAPHSVLLVLDATTGQNAVQQVKVFKEMVAVTGLVVTKLDGSARGGIVVALAETFGLPVHAVGVGEKATDLRPFDAFDFARGLVGSDAGGPDPGPREAIV